MSQVRLSRSARQDILEITDYISDRNVDAAIRLRDRLFAAFERLARRPAIGHVRDDLVPRAMGVRFWPVGTYLIVYRASGDGIGLVRVLSGHRDIAALLTDR